MEELIIEPDEDIKLDIETAAPICRGCLTTARRMSNAMHFEALFKELTGITVSNNSIGLFNILNYTVTCLKYKFKVFSVALEVFKISVK